MLLPAPNNPLKPPVDEPVEARWRTPSNSDGTPITFARRFVSTPQVCPKALRPARVSFSF
jgi:hypothetical protein